MITNLGCVSLELPLGRFTHVEPTGQGLASTCHPLLPWPFQGAVPTPRKGCTSRVGWTSLVELDVQRKALGHTGAHAQWGPLTWVADEDLEDVCYAGVEPSPPRGGSQGEPLLASPQTLGVHPCPWRASSPASSRLADLRCAVLSRPGPPSWLREHLSGALAGVVIWSEQRTGGGERVAAMTLILVCEGDNCPPTVAPRGGMGGGVGWGQHQPPCELWLWGDTDLQRLAFCQIEEDTPPPRKSSSPSSFPPNPSGEFQTWVNRRKKRQEHGPAQHLPQVGVLSPSESDSQRGQTATAEGMGKGLAWNPPSGLWGWNARFWSS